MIPATPTLTNPPFERENLDGENGIFYAQYAVCPYCGEDWFSEIPEEEDSK